jgi:aminoglycoside 6'-N-acetyltransferase I
MTPEVCIRQAQPSDCQQLALFDEALWPDSSAEQRARDLTPILEGSAILPRPLMNLIAEASGQKLVGFLEVGLRSHADGCNPACSVGFIEGW